MSLVKLLGINKYMKELEDNIDATFYPSENPGAYERHLIRRHENALFGDRATEVTSDSLQQNQ